jgi:hypothetical protein
MVVCLVKDPNESEAFTTRLGKNLQKKIITLCDPI